MGFWDLINSTTESVKQNVPGPAAYGYCTGALGKIDNAVRVNGMQMVNNYMPDEETRSKISLFASKLAQNAAGHAVREGYKLIPGGKAVAEVISATMDDVKSESHNSKLKMVAAATPISSTGGGGKISGSRNLIDRVEEMQSRGVETTGYHDKGNLADLTANYQTPEDVLRIFMMKEFLGSRFADDLLLPQVKHGIKNTKTSK